MNYSRKLMLFTVLIGVNASFGMSYENASKLSATIMKGITGTIYDNPIESCIGGYFLVFNREAIKQNVFWSAIWGASMISSLAKNTFSVQSSKNCILKTLIENPFFSMIAAHSLLFHRDCIKDNPLEALVVGGVLAYEFSKNYLGKDKATDDSDDDSRNNDGSDDGSDDAK